MNILLVGLGSIGKKHIRALQDIGVDATVYALRSGQSHESVDGVIDIATLADAPVCDFAMVCNPTDMHADTIADLAPLGIPLFIEKPVVRHVSELATLQHLNVPTYVACHLRHHPCLQYIREAIDDKEVHSMHAYCGSYMPEWVPGADWTKSFRADKERSGGVHLELIHEMDYCYWLFGAPSALHSALQNSGELGIDIIDTAHYELMYPTFSGQIDVNYTDRTPRRTLDITCSDSRWHVDILQFRVEKDGKLVFSSDMTVQDVYASQMQYFLNCLHSRTSPMNSVQEAGEVLTLALS